MRKCLLTLIFVVTTALFLSGCTYFEADYESVEEYAPPVADDVEELEKITVSDIASLRQAIRTIISNRESNGKIVFDSGYTGDPTTDMSKACWQVRTQDALCAYWVENISYELSKIVTYYEARLSISYSDFVKNSEDIVYLAYSAGIEPVIQEALVSGESKLVLLVDHSMYTAEDVSGLVLDAYRKNPVSTPVRPLPTVNMFSGSNMQRLYEIIFYYELSETELALRREKLSSFSPFSDVDTDNMSDSDKALLAFEYLVENCRVRVTSGRSSAYDALVGGEADSEGIALAMVALCHQLGLDCQIVYGQHDWQEHCWNIVGIDGYYCHIDAGLYGERAVESCFMKSDESFWESYRWDMSSYPACGAGPAGDDNAATEEIIPEESENDEPQHTAQAETEDYAGDVPEGTNNMAATEDTMDLTVNDQREILVIEITEGK